MPPRLAREAVTAAALRGDSAALLSACAYLPAREAFRYDRRRAAAFSSALAGERQLALSELGLGGGVRSVRLGLDTAVIELLTRGAAPAVEAVGLALRDGVHGEPDVPLLLAACVRRDPALARSALAVAVSGGTTLERTRAAAAVIGAARPRPVEAAAPALVAVSLAVAVLAFLRLPGLIDAQEAATPRLQEPRPSIVVAGPSEEAGEGAARTGTPGSSTRGDAQIPVRFTPGETGFASADGTGSLHGRAAAPPPAKPRPTPAAPAPASAPAPSAPGQPSPPASSPPLTTQSSPASGPASIAAPAAAPPAEDPRQPAVVKRSKAERKTEKAARKAEKAEQKAARKADSPQPAGPVTASVAAPEAEAAAAIEPTSAPDDASARQRKPDKPGKPDKGK